MDIRFDGMADGEILGWSVSDAGDVDGDGIDDVIVGARLASPNGLSFAGSVLVFSGATGAQLFRFDGLSAGDQLGWSVAGAGDVDGDGVPDLVVGAPCSDPNGRTDSGSAFVFSGATGTQIHRWDGLAAVDRFGSSVSGAGDVDGDGFADLIVGAPEADPNGLSQGGSAFLFSGATGTQIFGFAGAAAGALLGFSVSAAGDVDGDGFADLIVGAPGPPPTGAAGAGSVFVFSGVTGAQLGLLTGLGSQDRFGFSVSSAGDVDGDGIADLMVGAPTSTPGSKPYSGSAFVFSGATGNQLFRFDGRGGGEGLGASVWGPGDVNGDGFADLMVGAPNAVPGGQSSGSAFVFSGATGDRLFRLNGMDLGDAFGFSVSGGGDVDGDGRADLVVGAYGADPSGLLAAGSAFVFTFNPILTASSATFSVSAGGTIDYAIDFPDVDSGQKYGILLSAKGTGPTLFKGLRIPLKMDGFFVASTHGNTPPQGSNFQGTLDPQGQALAQFTAAPGSLPAKLIGRSIFLAAVNKKLDFSSVARRIDFLP